MPEKYNIKDLLLVGHNIPAKDDIVFQQFEKMTVKDSINMPLFREPGMKFILQGLVMPIYPQAIILSAFQGLPMRTEQKNDFKNLKTLFFKQYHFRRTFGPANYYPA